MSKKKSTRIKEHIEQTLSDIDTIASEVEKEAPKSLDDILTTFEGKYLIVEHESIMGLCFEMDAAMKQGYKPQGGMVPFRDPKEGRWRFMQAVIKD